MPCPGRSWCSRAGWTRAPATGLIGLDAREQTLASRGFDRKGEVQLVSEAAKTRLLPHPNIVRVFDLASDDGAGALIMNWVDGESLETIRKSRRSGRFSVSEIRPSIRELCRAVAYAHRRQILHLDIKPQNCLIDQDGRLMLTDFGIAGMGHPNAGEFSIFHTRNNGTPGYAAPEQLAGNTAAVAQDIYGIGATIYCLLVGHPPRMDSGGFFLGRNSVLEDRATTLRNSVAGSLQRTGFRWWSDASL